MSTRAREDAIGWGGMAGVTSLVFGAIGGALERGWPSPNDPDEVAHFIAFHRPTILAQSFAFLLSAAAFLWFLASLREVLARDTERPLASIAFGSGVAWVVMQMTSQALQIGQAMAPPEADPSLLATMSAMFSVANLPLAMVLGAVAIACFEAAVLPRWLGVLSVVAALAEVLLFAGAFVEHGPLAPNGWLTYALYPAFAVWLVPVSILMWRESGEGHAPRGHGGTMMPSHR